MIVYRGNPYVQPPNPVADAEIARLRKIHDRLLPVWGEADCPDCGLPARTRNGAIYCDGLFCGAVRLERT